MDSLGNRPSPSVARRVQAVLGSLVLLDLVLSVWGFAFPDLWYATFHASPLVDPQALLQRCAANWAAFFALQLLALLRWRRETWWLPVVAGCRLGDCLTDVTCLALCERISLLGTLAFPLAGAGNLLCGWWLLRAHSQLRVAEA